MAYYSAINPYPIFLDLRGGGLNGGRVYIGEPAKDPEVFPVPIFWDEAGTDPAAQPIETIGGYIVRAGTPAQVYGPTEYSIRVRDRFGAQVFYEADARGPLGEFIDNLASPSGADLVGFSHASSYSSGTVGAKLRQMVSVLDDPFKADPTGILDSTAAFNGAYAALPAVGGSIYVPAGTYKVGQLDHWTKPVRLYGDGEGLSIIKTSSATGDVITFDVAYCMVQGIAFDASVTRTAGAYIKMTKNVIRSRVRDFAMFNGFTGIEALCVDSVWIDTGDIFDTATNGFGIRLLGDGAEPAGNDIYINKITMSGNSNRATAGIQITNNGAVNITDCDIIRHGADLLINPGSGETCTTVYCLNTYFDTATYGCLIDPAAGGTVQGIRFVGCWFGNQSQYGIAIGATGAIGGIELISPQITDNISGGILLDGGVDFHCSDGYIAAKTAGVSNLVTVSAGVSAWHFKGTRIGDGYLKNGGAVGIFIAAGASTNWSIVGCDLTGNTIAVSDNSTGAHKIASDNMGWSPGYASAIATPYAISGLDRDVTFNISGTATVALPAPSQFIGRKLRLRTINSAVQSSAANVVPVAGGAAGTALLSAGGKWAELISDGTNWQVMAAN